MQTTIPKGNKCIGDGEKCPFYQDSISPDVGICNLYHTTVHNQNRTKECKNKNDHDYKPEN